MSERLHITCKGFIDAVSAANRNNERRGQGGQQVSFHGDFCSAPPSALIQLTRWAREIELAMNEETNVSDERASLHSALGSALALTYVPTASQDEAWAEERTRIQRVFDGEDE